MSCGPKRRLRLSLSLPGVSGELRVKNHALLPICKIGYVSFKRHSSLTEIPKSYIIPPYHGYVGICSHLQTCKTKLHSLKIRCFVFCLSLLILTFLNPSSTYCFCMILVFIAKFIIIFDKKTITFKCCKKYSQWWQTYTRFGPHTLKCEHYCSTGQVLVSAKLPG